MKQLSIGHAKNGFTVVELIVVIVVIGILAGISTVSYLGLQERGRDTERQADVETLQATFETYRDQTGRYPDQSQVITNAATFFSAQRTPTTALVVPNAGVGTTSSIIWGTTSTVDNYGYRAQKSDNTDCLTSSDTCTKYSLTYKSEASGTVVTITSKYGQS